MKKKGVKIVLIFFCVDSGRVESGASRVKSALFEKIVCCQEGGRDAGSVSKDRLFERGGRGAGSGIKDRLFERGGRGASPPRE